MLLEEIERLKMVVDASRHQVTRTDSASDEPTARQLAHQLAPTPTVPSTRVGGTAEVTAGAMYNNK